MAVAPQPERVGKYTVQRELGRGGMGVVYLATDTSLGRDVALKLVHPALVSDPQFAVRFEREARAVAGLSHPHIVHLNAFFREGNVLGIDMPYLPGGSLREQLCPAIPPARVLWYLIQVLQALDYCHGLGMIHRDVKPSNILLDDRGQAKLSDFGIAKLLDDAFRDATMSHSTGCFVGTPSYAPPESWDLAEPSPAWDIYAAGIVAWECLTGRLPYPAESPWKLMAQLRESPPPPLRTVVPHASAVLTEAVEWMIRRDPADRASNAQEVIAVLRSAPEFAAEPETLAPTSVSRSLRQAPRDSYVNRMRRSFAHARKRPGVALVSGVAFGALGCASLLPWFINAGIARIPEAPYRPRPVLQRDAAAKGLPALEALMAATRSAGGAEARSYVLHSESTGGAQLARALVLDGPGGRPESLVAFGPDSLWSGSIAATEEAEAYTIAGHWLALGAPALFSSGEWSGTLRLPGASDSLLLDLSATRLQDLQVLRAVVAGERAPVPTDTEFALELESQAQLPRLLFREGLLRDSPVAASFIPLLPAWSDGAGTLLDTGETPAQLDGKLAEPYWNVRPGPVIGRPTRGNPILMLAIEEGGILAGVEVPEGLMPAAWELRLLIAPAASPGSPQYAITYAEGGGSVALLGPGGSQALTAQLGVQISRNSSRVQIECEVKGDWLESLAALPAGAWRCNARLSDTASGSVAAEWGAPDWEALQHGVLFFSPGGAAT
ncbi:MAG: protein kinase [Candidatus Hydrogenedens sp.]|nr:protein kinase [Candidatus Hydrogenedens sp.]